MYQVTANNAKTATVKTAEEAVIFGSGQVYIKTKDEQISNLKKYGHTTWTYGYSWVDIKEIGLV